MALLKSKQLSTNLSGSYTITGSLETTENISGSYTSTGSVGRLEVAGNSNLTGDITIGGNMTFGDADTDSVSITADLTSNLIPNADSTYDIGSSAKNWRFGYIEQLSATHVTASGHISGSSTSTGSFGRVSTSTLDLSSIQGNWTNAGNTIADLGSVTTVDINGGTVDSITSLTAGGNLDIGAYDLRAQTLTADGLSSGRVVFAGTNGVLSDDSDLTFSTATLSATNLTTTGTIKDFSVVSGSAVSTGSFGHLIIQGNVTASGTIRADAFQSVTGGTTIDFNDSLDIAGDVTASGDISASYTSTGSFGSVHTTGYVGIGTTQPTYELDVAGDIGLDRYLYHNGDTDTRFNITSDRIRVEAGGVTFIDINNTTQDVITLGGSSDIDAKLQGGDGYVFIQGSDGYVGIKDTSPSYQLDVAGTGRFTGVTKVTDTTNSTSTSTGALIIDGGVGIVKDLVVGGIVTAQEFHTEFVSASIQYTSGSTQFGNTEDDTHTFSGSLFLNKDTTEEFIISGSGVLSGSYTSTGSFGRVSTAGDIYSSGRIYESGTSVVDHATAMAIVFGG